MFLVTPDSGLLIWMTLIFGVVFFILAKWGFPAITGAVDTRTRHINEALKKAAEAEERMRNLSKEQADLIAQTKKEQGRILREASQTKEQIISQAKEQASEEAAKLISQARTEIAAEKESALRDIRKEVALLSVQVTEKVVRKELSSDQAQLEYIDRLVEEMSAQKDNKQSAS